MSAPIKPWERESSFTTPNRDRAQEVLGSSVTSVHPAGQPAVPTSVQPEIHGSGRPPVPPRPDTTQNHLGLTNAGGVYGAGYGGLTGYGGMGGMGMYSSPMMGGYGGYSPYNRMGMGYGQSMGDMNNSFIQMAEASSRGAFHSVESVVSAVSSVSMMLESTYFALQNSFRAVLGVADQFSRLKMQLSQVAASFAVFKFIRWLYRRLLVLLGLRKAGLSDDAWTNALKKSAEEAQDRFPGQKKSSWPLVLFFAIALGGPYMIWRMISNMYKDEGGWAEGTEDHVVGEAKFDFVADREDELSLTQGQRINLAPADLQPRLRENDWILASSDGRTGVVPASYIRILGKRKGKPKLTPVVPDAQSANDRTIPVTEPNSEAVTG